MEEDFDDLRALIQRHGVIGAAAGSLFVFKGKYRAVLINYPGRAEKDALFSAASRAMADTVRYAAEFGMTPSARSRLASPPGVDTSNPFAEFVA